MELRDQLQTALRRRRSVRGISIALAGASVLASVASHAQAPVPPPGAIRPGLTAFSYINPDGRPDTADAGSFRVPARRDLATADSLTIVFSRLRTRSPHPVAPVVLLA